MSQKNTEGTKGKKVKDAYYFKHDSNARNDPKILSAISVYGIQAYAWYFIIIEILRDQTNYTLPITKYTWDALAMQTHSDSNTIEKFVNDCCFEFVDDGRGLLSKDDENIWSESLFLRMKGLDEKRQKARAAANTRWNKNKPCKRNANASKSQCERNANRTEQNRTDKKEKNIEEKKFGTFSNVYLTDSELEKLQAAYPDYMDRIDRLSSYMESKGVAYKSHYATILNWSRKDQPKPATKYKRIEVQG